MQDPYIVKIYDCCKIKSYVYIVLEFCGGGSLEDIIEKRQGKLSEKDAKIILFQIVQGLKAIHSKRIAHRDLKPENIFIKEKIFKLGDFGFASDKNKFQTSLGTQPYMAPEILSAEPFYTVKVDVWALGVMFHKMLFGSLPFDAGTLFQLQALFQKMKRYRIPKGSNISKGAESVLNNMLNKNVNKRISSEQLDKHPYFDDIRNLPFMSQTIKPQQHTPLIPMHSNQGQNQQNTMKNTNQNFQNCQSNAFAFQQPEKQQQGFQNASSNVFQQQQNINNQQQGFQQPQLPQPSFDQPSFPQPHQQSGFPQQQQKQQQPQPQPKIPKIPKKQPQQQPQQPQIPNLKVSHTQNISALANQFEKVNIDKFQPKVWSKKDDIHKVVINYRNMLFKLWKTYESLGQKEFWEAAFLMGEKLSKQLFNLQTSIENKKLLVKIGKISPKNWLEYCNSSRALKFLDQKLRNDNKLLGSHFNNLSVFLTQSKAILQSQAVLQSKYPIRKQVLLSVADVLIQKGHYLIALDVVLFSDFDKWMNIGISRDQYDNKIKKLNQKQQKMLALKGKFEYFIL